MANYRQREIITIKDVRMIFCNFKGERRKFNEEGNRNFNLDLTPAQAEMLQEHGLNVRVRPPRGDDEEPQYLLPVKVSYRYREPKVVLISGGQPTKLTEDDIGVIDDAAADRMIEHVDLSIRTSPWSMDDGREGVSAYLNSLYVTLLDDELEKEYSDRFDAPPAAVGEDDEEMPF